MQAEKPINNCISKQNDSTNFMLNCIANCNCHLSCIQYKLFYLYNKHPVLLSN